MATFDIDGQFDGIKNGCAFGWASGQARHIPVAIVDVLIDGVLVETLVADRFRPDLERAAIRGGRAGFLFDVPEAFWDGEAHTVDIRHHGTEQSLANSPQTFTLMRPAVLTERGRETWALSNLVLRDDSQEDGFEDRIRLSRKVAIISTYHDAGRFLSYHETLFRVLSESGFVTIIVHASGSSDGGIAATRIPGCYTIVKRNVGYDFGSWAVAIYRLRSHFDEIDELVLLNDSVIPVDADQIETVIRRARSSGADVVGLTDSYEHVYHLQSYFLWLNGPALRSTAFHDFMTAYSFSSIKEVVIEEGELAFTKRLLAAGFSVQALFEYDTVASLWLENVGATVAEIEELPAAKTGRSGEDYRNVLIRQLERVTASLVEGRAMNPTHFFWDTLIERCGFPFLKRELALMNPGAVATYFRIGRVLHKRPDALGAVKEIRRIYGGNLLPMLVPGPTSRPSFASTMSAQGGHANQLAVVG